MSKKISQIQKDKIKSQLKEFPDNIVESHIDRLDIDYFNQFKIEEIKSHLAAIQYLSSEKLCDIKFKQIEKNKFSLTIVGFDFIGLFSIISGLLTLYNFNIQSGKIFTYKKLYKEDLENYKTEEYHFHRKKIIDYLEIIPNKNKELYENFEKNYSIELNNYLQLVQKKKYQEVRYQLNKRIGNYLSTILETDKIKLLPIDIDIDNEDNFTILKITGQDTPAFLFSLSNALSIKGISIHKIWITTQNNNVSDILYITDRYENAITNPEYLNNLKIAIVLIKQFTLLLPAASDPNIAIQHFDQLIDALILNKNKNINLLDINNEFILASLAKLFGTGDYLWENFIRMQYENLLPLLKNINNLKNRKSKKTMLDELKDIISAIESNELKVKAINDYKNNELFRIDISHLIYHNKTFIQFSEELTDLAEVIISVTVELIFDELLKEYGNPMCDSKICDFGIFALGKFGGAELGYASDIEIVLIYEAPGFTDKPDNSISNSEFFILIIQRMLKYIEAKDAGIFQIDLRLRPFGNKGPLASSFKKWTEYYSEKGSAYNYEKQLIIKLRPVYGNREFTDKIMAAREDIIFSEKEININNTIELRKKQIETLVKPDELNAKFSPGGLTDIEYSVQFLQLKYGNKYPELREQNTIKALEKLLELDIITPTEFEKLYNSYAFLRRLINALRMVKGNAKDLVIPPLDSDEFFFLAKRLGYVQKKNFTPQQQLEYDIKITFDAVSKFFKIKFIEQKNNVFKESGLPVILIEDNVSAEEVKDTFERLNIYDNEKIFDTLRNIAKNCSDKNLLVTMFVLAERYISHSPDADKVIINFEKYLSNSKEQSALLKQMIFHPRYIEILVLIFGYSDFLSNIIINEPYLIHYFSNEDILFENKNYEHFSSELNKIIMESANTNDTLDLIRKYRNREIIRIGLRDIYLNISLEKIVKEISDLADVIITAVYNIVLKSKNSEELSDIQTIIALGKLGGRELNYSSDIDILFVSTNLEAASQEKTILETIDNTLIQLLTSSSQYGQLFRVDTRLRPYGRAGMLVGAYNHYIDYYNSKADGWELQAWLKARQIAGNVELGKRVIFQIQNFALLENNHNKIFQSISKLRKAIYEQLKKENIADREVKLGAGGIRTIEFIVQHYQIKNGNNYPDILSGNTLYALSKFKYYKIIKPDIVDKLKESYIFLRKVEHRIQLLGWQQRHLLPESEIELSKLAKRMGYEDRVQENALRQFLKDYKYFTNTVITISENIYNE